MNPRPDDVEALASAIDRVVFAQAGRAEQAADQQSAAALISHLYESFPRVAPTPARRARLERRIIRALGIPSGSTNPAFLRLEAEMNRRLRGVNPRWTPVLGGAALVLLGVVGFAYWRQRSSVKPAIAASIR